MQSFLEFLHGDNWTKPLLPDDSKVMRRIVRSGQEKGGVPTWRSTTTIPAHQRLMMVLWAAGPQGISHTDLAAQIDLDGDLDLRGWGDGDGPLALKRDTVLRAEGAQCLGPAQGFVPVFVGWRGL